MIGHPVWTCAMILLITFANIGLLLHDLIRYQFNYPILDEFRNTINKAAGGYDRSTQGYYKRRDTFQKIF